MSIFPLLSFYLSHNPHPNVSADFPFSFFSNRRIRSLESHVSDIRNTQHTIQNTLLELITQLRGGAAGPSSFRQSPVGASPYTNNNVHSPASNGTVTGMSVIDPSLSSGGGGGGSSANVPSRTGSLPAAGHDSPATPHAVVGPNSALKRSSSSLPSSYQGPPPPPPQFVPGRSQQSYQNIPPLTTFQGVY